MGSGASKTAEKPGKSKENETPVKDNIKLSNDAAKRKSSSANYPQPRNKSITEHHGGTTVMNNQSVDKLRKNSDIKFAKRLHTVDNSFSSSDKINNRHSIGSTGAPGRTSVISVQRPGATMPVMSNRGSVGAKVSRHSVIKSTTASETEKSDFRSSDSRRKSRKEPSRHSLQMMHQSRQSVISLQVSIRLMFSIFLLNE